MNEQAVINEITESAETIVPEVVEAVHVVKNNPYLLAGVALVAASAGAGLGYFIAMKRLEPKYSKIAEEEIRQAKEYYSVLHKGGKFSTPKDAVDELITEYKGESVEIEETEEGIQVTTTSTEVDNDDNEVEVVKEVTRNIFVNGQPIDEDEFDYESEVANRRDDRPFVITEAEFFENETLCSQETLTYYAGDDVLTDDKDMVLEDVDDLVGNENLNKFGHGSKDRNLLYIRNVEKDLEFEIARSQGKFSEEVLGLDEAPELRHGMMRFRGGDD